MPQKFTLEIGYSNDENYITVTIEGMLSYLLPEEDWKTILEKAPSKDGIQTVRFRIKTERDCCESSEPYYTSWAWFYIQTENLGSEGDFV